MVRVSRKKGGKISFLKKRRSQRNQRGGDNTPFKSPTLTLERNPSAESAGPAGPVKRFRNPSPPRRSTSAPVVLSNPLFPSFNPFAASAGAASAGASAAGASAAGASAAPFASAAGAASLPSGPFNPFGSGKKPRPGGVHPFFDNAASSAASSAVSSAAPSAAASKAGAASGPRRLFSQSRKGGVDPNSIPSPAQKAAAAFPDIPNAGAMFERVDVDRLLNFLKEIEVRKNKPVDQQNDPLTVKEKEAITKAAKESRAIAELIRTPPAPPKFKEFSRIDNPSVVYYQNLFTAMLNDPLSDPLPDPLPINDIIGALVGNPPKRIFGGGAYQHGGSSSKAAGGAGHKAEPENAVFHGFESASASFASYPDEFDISIMDKQMLKFVKRVVNDDAPVPIEYLVPNDEFGDFGNFFIEPTTPDHLIFLKPMIAFAELGDTTGRMEGGGNSKGAGEGAGEEPVGQYPARRHGELGIAPDEQCSVIIGTGKHSICWLCGYLTDMFKTKDDIQSTVNHGPVFNHFIGSNDGNKSQKMFDVRFLDSNRADYQTKTGININPNVLYGFMDVERNPNKGGGSRPITDDPPITAGVIRAEFASTRIKEDELIEIIKIFNAKPNIIREEVKERFKGFSGAQIAVLKRLTKRMTAADKIRDMTNFMLLLTKQVCEHVLPVLVAAILFLLYNANIHKANCYRTEDFEAMLYEYLDAHHLCNCLKSDELWLKFVKSDKHYHGTTVDEEAVNAFLKDLWDHERFVQTTDTKCASTVFCRLQNGKLIEFKNTVQYEAFLESDETKWTPVVEDKLKGLWKDAQRATIIRRLTDLIEQIKKRDVKKSDVVNGGEIGSLYVFSKTYFDTLKRIISPGSPAPSLKDYWTTYANSIPDPAPSFIISRSLYWAGARTAAPLGNFQARLLLFSLMKQDYKNSTNKEIVYLKGFDQEYVNKVEEVAPELVALLQVQLERYTTFRKEIIKKGKAVEYAGSAAASSKAVNERALHPYIYTRFEQVVAQTTPALQLKTTEKVAEAKRYRVLKYERGGRGAAARAAARAAETEAAAATKVAAANAKRIAVEAVAKRAEARAEAAAERARADAAAARAKAGAGVTGAIEAEGGGSYKLKKQNRNNHNNRKSRKIRKIRKN